MAIIKRKVTRAQTLIDMCLQVYGTTQQLFRFAKDNGLQVDSTISIGDELIYDDAFGDLLVLDKIQSGNLSIINPVRGQSSTIEYWTDGIGIILTDGLGNPFPIKN